MEKIFKLEMRDWAKGDLVKITGCNYDGSPINSFGVVAVPYFNDEKQTKIFPAISVYNLSTGTIKDYYVYDLELVSSTHS